MSKLSSFFVSIESSVAESLLTGAFSGSVSAGLTTLLEANPELTETQAIASINSDLTTYLSSAITKLPGYVAPIAEILLTVGTPAIQSWVDSIISEAYNKLVSQLVGTKNATTVMYTASPVVSTNIVS